MLIRVTPLASALRTAIFGLSLVTASHSAIAASPVTTGEHSQAQAFDIPAGNLDRVLGAFGQQAGVMVGIDSALSSGVQSSGLQGSFAVEEGLERLLGPVGLQAEPADGGYRVVAKPCLLYTSRCV